MMSISQQITTNIRRGILFAALLLVSGCSTAGVEQYRTLSPKLDIIAYFTGSTRGWGIVQDRWGNLKRQFVVDLTGTVHSSGALVLEEDFTFSDGERSRRVWTISRSTDGSLNGTADDVDGTAVGSAAGNALNWHYRLLVAVDGSTWNLTFDDWMFLQPDDMLLNRASMNKFGFRVGEVTIAFTKNSVNTRN